MEISVLTIDNSSKTGRDERLLALPDVLARTATKRSTLYSWISKGLFPGPVSIGPRRVAWRGSDIDRWIAERCE